MKCYEDDGYGYNGDPVPCDPTVPLEVLQWLAVTAAGLVVLFIALAVLGQVHDWIANRYGDHEETPTTPVTGSKGPML